MTGVRDPKAFRIHMEQLDKRIRRDAQRDEAERRRHDAAARREHQDGLRALEAAVVTSAIEAQR